MPNFHSIIKPIIIIKLIKKKETKKKIFLFDNNKGKGIIITISTSKIRKIIAIKKNFREKGTREIEKGSKPHSNGDNFSLFWKFLNLKIPKQRKIIPIIKKIILKIIRIT